MTRRMLTGDDPGDLEEDAEGPVTPHHRRPSQERSEGSGALGGVLRSGCGSRSQLGLIHVDTPALGSSQVWMMIQTTMMKIVPTQSAMRGAPCVRVRR